MTTETVRPAATAALPLRTPESVLFQLLTDLDAAPDDASALRLTLNAIIAVVPCEQAFLHVRDERTDAPQLQRSAATDRAFFRDYATHFRVMDPFASEAVQQRCIRENRSLASEDILAPEAMRQTPFHTQFLARHGNLAHGLCRHAILGKHQHTDLRLFRRADQAAFSWQERELVDLFHNQIAPPAATAPRTGQCPARTRRAACRHRFDEPRSVPARCQCPRHHVQPCRQGAHTRGQAIASGG